MTFYVYDAGQEICFLGLEPGSLIKMKYDGGTDELGSFSANTWYRLETEWKDDNTCRARFGTSEGSPGTWTAYRSSRGTWTAADKIFINNVTGTNYVDEFSEPAVAVPEDERFIHSDIWLR